MVLGRYLPDEQSIEDEDVMVVLGQRHDEALAGDLQSAASGDLDGGAVEVLHLGAAGVEHGDVELVAVAVTHEDVARVGDVDAVGEGRDALVADLLDVAALVVDDAHAVALEVGDVVVAAAHRDVRGLFDVELGDVDAAEAVAGLGDLPDHFVDAVHDDDVAGGVNCDTGDCSERERRSLRKVLRQTGLF